VLRLGGGHRRLRPSALVAGDGAGEHWENTKFTRFLNKLVKLLWFLIFKTSCRI
jgi:hypothetical protein